MLTTDVELLDELKDFVTDEGWCRAFRHPLVNFLPYDERMNATLHDELVKKAEVLEQAMHDKDWSLALQLHEKPWRMDALVEMAGDLTDEEYWHFLGQVWIEVENLPAHGDESFRLFDPRNRDASKRQFLMTDDERAVLDALPETVEVYRLLPLGLSSSKAARRGSCATCS